MRSYKTQELLTEDSATDVRLQQFSKQIKRSNRRTKFNAEIVSEYPSNHFFMAWLSKKALKWVRFSLPMYLPLILLYQYQ